MGHVFEHQGRLARTDGRDVAAGTFDLRFRLHLHREGPQHVWEEVHPGVVVGNGGVFGVLLGASEPLEPDTFAQPRWLALYVDQRGVSTEVGVRTPMVGAALRLATELEVLTTRLARLEARTPRALAADAGGDPEARRRLLKLYRRVRKLEGGGLTASLAPRILEVERRLTALDDAEDGRILRLEDEVVELVGADGDLVDLTERLEALEAGHGGPMHLVRTDPELVERVARAEARAALAELQVRALQKSVDALLASAARPAEPPAPPDTLPGPLTVKKGGIHVASGGLVVRDIEGRVAGASRREGALLLNSRTGGDVVIGTTEAGNLAVPVALRAASAPGVARVLALRFAGDPLPVGTPVAIDVRRKQTWARAAAPNERAIGVAIDKAGLELGAGAVLVAVAGVVSVRVRGPVDVGAALIVDEMGQLGVGSGPGIGRALTASAEDTGTVEMLLTP